MNWKDFENCVLEFYTRLLEDNPTSKITKNVIEEGPFGKRQFDIVIETDVADFCIRTIIECKFHARKLDIEYIDAFSSKLNEAKGNKGIIVSSNGFTKQALKKAQHYGIEAYTLQEAARTKIDASLHFPFLLRYIQPQELVARVVPPPFVDPKSLHSDSADGIMHLIYNSLSFLHPADVIYKSEISLSLKDLHSPFNVWMKTKAGAHVQLSNVSLTGKIVGPIYFGFAHDIPGSMIKRDELRPKSEIQCSIENPHTLAEHFTSFDSIDQIPLNDFPAAMLIVCHPPKIDFTCRVFLGSKALASP